MWMTEMFLDALSIPYIVIRSQMTTDQRNACLCILCLPIEQQVLLDRKDNSLTAQMQEEV
ncbi:hypothetical protein BDV40DRAFT_262393, partial [Aspergillus tamarii]